MAVVYRAASLVASKYKLNTVSTFYVPRYEPHHVPSNVKLARPMQDDRVLDAASIIHAVFPGHKEMGDTRRLLEGWTVYIAPSMHECGCWGTADGTVGLKDPNGQLDGG